MLQKRLILHIGANKTGTSSIQKMLLENRDVLQAAGWDYPDFHLLHMAHHPLAHSISGHPTYSLDGPWEADFRALLADRDRRLIFSSELFFRTVDPRTVARFFPPGETLVILYLREHLAYMMSWYAQAIQERNLTASFADYLRLFPQPFSGYLQSWQAVYGAENIVTRVFDRAALTGQDSRRDFLQFIAGVDAAQIQISSHDSNLSISGNLLFFKTLLNLYMSFEEATAPPITDEIGAYAEIAKNFHGKFHVTATEARLARHLFQDDAARLAEQGIVLPKMPRQVVGHRYPDFRTLAADFKLIKDIAVRTDKRFLKFMARMP